MESSVLLATIVVFLLAQACFLYLIRKKLLVDIKHEVRESMQDVWDARMAAAVERLTHPSTIAEVLSHMTPEQLASLADEVAELRSQNG